MLRADDRRTRLVLAGVSVALVIGVVFSLFQAGAAQRGRDAEAMRRAEATARGIVLPLLSANDLTRPATEERAETLLGRVEAAIVEAGPAEKLTLWRPDGTILLSTDPKEIGTRLPGVGERLGEILDQGTATIVEDGRFRTLVPVQTKSAEAVIELDEPYGPIWSGANWPWRTLAFVLGFVSLISIGMLATTLRARGRRGEGRPRPLAGSATEPVRLDPAPVPGSPPTGSHAPSQAPGGPHPDLAAEVDARRSAEERAVDAQGRVAEAERELRSAVADAERVAVERDALAEELTHLRAQVVKLSSSDPGAEARAVAAEQRAELAERRLAELQELAQARPEGVDPAEVRALEQRLQAAERRAEHAEEQLASATGGLEQQLAQARQAAEAADERARRAEQRTREAIQEAVQAVEERMRIAFRSAEEQANAAQAGLQEMERRAEAAEARLAELEPVAEAAQQRLARAEAEREEAERLAAGSRAHVGALEAQIAQLQAKVSELSTPDPEAVRILQETEARAAEAERRAAEAEQRLVSLEAAASEADAELGVLREASETAEQRAVTSETALAEVQHREEEARRDLAQARIELDELRRKGGTGDGEVPEKVAELEAELELVRSRLENTEAHASRLARELEAREAISAASANGEAKEPEQLLKVAQERLAASSEALMRAEERAYEAERKLTELLESGPPADGDRRASKVEEALHHLSGEAVAEGVLEDRRASSPFKQALALDAKNSLTSILGIVMTLKHREATPDQQPLLRDLNQQARKLDHLVADLLDADRLARGEVKLQRRRTDLDALVHRVVEESGLTREREITIYSESVAASVAPARVEQIVSSLLAGAADRTKPGGKIWVHVDRTEGGALLSVQDEQPASVAAISPLVQRFAELHGGWARVESREGGGSSFRVFLAEESADPEPSDGGDEGDVVITDPTAELPASSG